jgi:hypothetical protein
MMMFGGVEVYLHMFLIFALDGGEWSASCPRERAPGFHWIGGWMGPSAGLDAVAKRKILALSRNQPPVIQATA